MNSWWIRRRMRKATSILTPVLFLVALILGSLILLSSAAQSAQDEAYGVVTNVVDGDTFDVTIEKADPRITYSVERVRLADVDSPEMDTPQGPAARDFTFAVLMNKRVYLDIDDLSNNGRDVYGRIICVAYLTGVYGQPIASPNVNRLLVDTGNAKLENSTDNEFDPRNWGSEQLSGDVADPLQALPQNLQENLQQSLQNPQQNQNTQKNDPQNDLLPKLQEAAGNELDRAAQGAWDWLKGQILEN